jgi:hypothetical protein
MKDSLKIKLITTIILVIITSVPFTSATSSIMNSSNKLDRIIKINQIQKKNLNYIEDFQHILSTSNIYQLNLEKSLNFLNLFSKFILLQFNEYPQVTNLCNQLLSKLDILGRDWSGFICMLLLHIFWIIDEISYYLIFDLGFPILGSIISIPLNFISLLFYSHCSWMYPYYLFSIKDIRFISGHTRSSGTFPCQCINQ